MKKILDQVITAQEAADMLGVSRRYIVKICGQGKLTARNAGSTWLILKSSVEALQIGREEKNQ